MVKPGRRFGLAIESLNLLFRTRNVWPKNFQRDASLQRFLDGLIDNPHAASTDFTQDLEVAQSLQRVGEQAAGLSFKLPLCVFLPAELFHHFNGRERRADVVCQFRMSGNVVVDGRPDAFAQLGSEFVRQNVDGVSVRSRVCHESGP